MIKIKEAIIVEGRYDRIKLGGLFDTAIIETGGFRIFKDDEKKNIIRQLAKKRGIIILTDSDGAGFVIRSHIKSITGDNANIKQAFIPDIEGKEKRKTHPSKEGLLGVEGMTDEIIVNAVLASGAAVLGQENNRRTHSEITKLDFYNAGLSGRENSEYMRKTVLSALGFPKYMTANTLLNAVNMIYEKEEFFDILEQIFSFDSEEHEDGQQVFTKENQKD